jgi:hypothetical protein
MKVLQGVAVEATDHKLLWLAFNSENVEWPKTWVFASASRAPNTDDASVKL